MRIAINGFGRIGRLVLRIITQKKSSNLEVIAINDLVPADNLAYLLKYDTVHRQAPFQVKAEGSHLIVDGKQIQVLGEKDPSVLPWKDLGNRLCG